MKKLILSSALLLLAACTATEEKPVVKAEPPPPPPVVTLDDGDRAILDRVLQTAVARPPGQIQEWSNPANGKEGSLTLIRLGFTRDGKRCGEVHVEARERGARGQQIKTVCADPAGKWQPDGGFTLEG